MENNLCPLCQKEGKYVNTTTVKHLVKKHLNVLVESSDTYFICKTKHCDVVYYNQAKETLFYRDELKVPVHFKKGAQPKYICYCNEITKNQIVDAIVNEHAMTINRVINKTGAMTTCNCEVNNPTGKCCADDIRKIIEQTKNKNRG